jgi:hypothetical protein
MLRNQPIRLKVSNREDLLLPVQLLNFLLVPAALLSPHPVFLTLCAILFVGAGWFTRTLKFPKANSVELTSVIFPDGKVRLESNLEESVAGFLDGQQWCTRWFAVLRFSNGNTVRKMIIRPSQQQGEDDFRRLNMWLRQDLFSNTTARQVLDS